MTQMKTWIACAGAALALAWGMPAPARAASPLPQEVTINGVEFVLIPEGWFYKTGGITGGQNDWVFQDNFGGGNVKVWLDSYYIAKFEARARDLVSYLNSGEGRSENYFGHDLSCSVRRGPDGKYFPLRPDDDLPATHLTWEQSDRWARWMGFRLPTEMEWEKAARGTDQRMYPWGNEHPDETYAGYNMEASCYTWPVSSFRKGLSPYGVYNMAGNVREFVADWYSAQHDLSLKDGVRNPPPPASGSTREPAIDAGQAGPWKLIKGGRWGSMEDEMRIGARIYYLADNPFRCNGVRFGLDAAAVREHVAKGTAIVTRQ